MAEPQEPQEMHPQDTDEARRAGAEHRRQSPTEPVDHGMERAPRATSLGQEVRAHSNRPHKGDVGRPGTNEEVFQGSKQKELP
ncbi:MAG: hypothetical protein WCA44_04575 [Acidobacteriaceae bacterium]|jgi:hypothetical protein